MGKRINTHRIMVIQHLIGDLVAELTQVEHKSEVKAIKEFIDWRRNRAKVKEALFLIDIRNMVVTRLEEETIQLQDKERLP